MPQAHFLFEGQRCIYSFTVLRELKKQKILGKTSILRIAK